MPDLSTRYLGLELAGPIVASAGPLTGRLETLELLQEAGAAAVVLPSLFEEEIVESAMAMLEVHSRGAEVFAEATSYLPELPGTESGPERHLQLVADAKARLRVPVIASLNGTTNGGWTRYAKELVEAGADALELNVYHVAADPDDTPASIERQLHELVREVRGSVDVPLAIKLSPYFTALAHMAVQLVEAGADGLVCFNRFYQPDIDLGALAVTPTLELSTPVELRLPLRWIAILHGRVQCSLAATGGVHWPTDVVKALLVGADVVMSTSALLRHGPEHLEVLRAGLVEWMEEHEYESVAQLRGSVSRGAIPDPDSYERANYYQVLHETTRRYYR
ncbi:MAG: dihydroorotate dehydrogenase-like protein [Acidimicrobiia bacterium]